ncbi:WG repeat-containing protein [Oceanirhabdus seepicola]|uniref:WG repeat-containing protein n=1 Tax=Oceanirhabdus seepicola TaxID=2828781 RepID=A0A9J6P0V8_9CLOT|nr:WG repeat-containing protein [Oceanirhabdus seepicola]
MASVCLKNKCGVINKKGELVIDAKYDCIGNFVEIK